MKIAILASGEGTNAQAIIDKIKSGALDARVAIIISNHAEAPVLARAAKEGIAHRAFEKKSHASREALDSAIVDCIVKTGCDLVVLAGYMLLIGGAFFEAFPNRIVNIHPSLLPAFPGKAAAEAAFNYGVKLTGASVQFVDQEMDAGPMIIQGAVPVIENEAINPLLRRIHAIEHRIYPQALQWIAEGRVSREGRSVRVAPGSRRQLRPDGAWFVWPPLEEGF